MSLLIILQIFMIIGAIIAIETSHLLSSIVCVGAVGFLLSIMFAVLGAPDIAIIQLVVEILCLIILIRATIARDVTAISGDREMFGLTVSIALLLAITALSIRLFTDFPPFGQSAIERFNHDELVNRDTRSGQAGVPNVIEKAPGQVYLEEGPARTGSANVLSSISLGFRAYDTLGQMAVLFCAVMGALAILRKTGKKPKGAEDADENTGA